MQPAEGHLQPATMQPAEPEARDAQTAGRFCFFILVFFGFVLFFACFCLALGGTFADKCKLLSWLLGTIMSGALLTFGLEKDNRLSCLHMMGHHLKYTNQNRVGYDDNHDNDPYTFMCYFFGKSTRTQLNRGCLRIKLKHFLRRGSLVLEAFVAIGFLVALWIDQFAAEAWLAKAWCLCFCLAANYIWFSWTALARDVNLFITWADLIANLNVVVMMLRLVAFPPWRLPSRFQWLTWGVCMMIPVPFLLAGIRRQLRGHALSTFISITDTLEAAEEHPGDLGDGPFEYPAASSSGRPVE